ncbi:MAG: hypothetical protein WBD07_00980 [Vicinamibacterales bacterium]
MSERIQQVVEEEWVSFPGGELEGKRPKALCPTCRKRGHPSQTLCFQCYRAGVDDERSLGSGQQSAVSSRQSETDIPHPQWQSPLPFESINRPRLERLKAERAAVRATLREGAGRFEERRRQAQIGARRALQRIDAALEARQLDPATRQRVMATAVHAAELQLPESWLPFVVAG